MDSIRRHDASVFLYALDLTELDGEDLRRNALAVRKARLASVLAPLAALTKNPAAPAVKREAEEDWGSSKVRNRWRRRLRSRSALAAKIASSWLANKIGK